MSEFPEQFPDIGRKLAAPQKLSAYERERRAAAEKQKRHEAERVALLKEIKKDFGGDDPPSNTSGGNEPPTGPRGGAPWPGGRYGAAPRGPRSGGPFGPGFGPFPSVKNRRELMQMKEAEAARVSDEEDDDGIFGSGTRRVTSGVQGHRSAAAAPPDQPHGAKESTHTVYLTNVPPNMADEDVKNLVAKHFKVLTVASADLKSTSKPTKTVTARLSPQMTVSQIEKGVAALDKSYLCCGFYLSISRRAPDAILPPTMPASQRHSLDLPFGAQSNSDDQKRASLRNAPPPFDHRQPMFAPPGHHGARATAPRADMTVQVRIPADIRVLRTVHAVVEYIRGESDSLEPLEKEALLMSLPEVQRDERYAFLYESSTPTAVYYRHLLWNHEFPVAASGPPAPERMFENPSIDWLPPHPGLPFEDVSSLDQLVSHPDYISSDEENNDADGPAKPSADRPEAAVGMSDAKGYLSPLQKARFTFLLCRLQTKTAMLTKDRVAGVTSFAMKHANVAAEEIVGMLLLNVERPFSLSQAARYEQEADEGERKEDDEYVPDDGFSAPGESTAAQADGGGIARAENIGDAMLVGLYVVSDLVASCPTPGFQTAWRYRHLIEHALIAGNVFGRLSRIDRELGWGKLKADQWKQRVGKLFETWESWPAFTHTAMQSMKQSFFYAPEAEEGREGQAAADKAYREGGSAGKAKQTVGQRGDGTSLTPTSFSPDDGGKPSGSHGITVNESATGQDVDGVPMDEVDGVPMEDDLDAPAQGDVDGEPMEEDLDEPPKLG